MAKRRDKKNGSRSKKKGNRKRGPRCGLGFGSVGFSARRVSPEELEQMMVDPPPGWVPVDQEKLAWMGCIGSDIDAFEREVAGLDEPSPGALVLGAAISGEVWARCGAAGGWQDLDVDAVMDPLRWLHEQDVNALHVFLGALITWLANTGRLDADAAVAKREALRRRESSTIAAMRAAVRATPVAHLAALELQRRERLAEARERQRALN